MTVPHPNRRTSDVERQLSAMASARERANNPVSLLALGVLALVVGLAILGWAAYSVASARGELSRERARAAQWDQSLATIASLSQSAPDLREMYPILSFIGSDYEDIRDAMFPNEIPLLSVSTHQRKRLLPDTALEQWDIEVSSVPQGVELERFMQFINAAIAKYRDRPIFVSQLTLRPMPGSAKWNASAKISNYQVSKDFVRNDQ